VSLDIAEAKRRLPLPDLLAKLGLGDHAKKSARCPLHEDGSNSFSVFQHNGGNFWKCHAGCGEGDEVTFLVKHETLSNGDAIRRFCALAGVNDNTARNTPLARPASPPVDAVKSNKETPDQSEAWRKSVAAFTDDHAAMLAKWRGYSAELVGWLRERELVGFYNGKIAFPVHGDGGKVLAIHFRIPPKAEGERARWAYWPEGVGVRLLAVGDVAGADYVAAFESQWDLLAVADKLGVHRKGGVPGWAFVATRGADNGKLLAGIMPKTAAVLAFAQNDPAGRKWLQSVADCAGVTVKHVATPEAHKDAADWCKAGATLADLDGAVMAAVELKPQLDLAATLPVDNELTPETHKPIVRPLAEFQVASDPTTDPRNLVGKRFLCRSGALLLAGPTGIGKSSLLLQLAICFAIGRPLFGIAPTGKLRTLLIQAENDDGDMAEMRDGVYRGLNLTPEEQAEAGAAVKVVCESVATGGQFIGLAGDLIAEHKPDLFLIDPLFAYCGCNVSDQEKMSAFLRNGLNPLLQAHGCGLILAHHTNKPKSGKEKPDWQGSDFAYLGSGTAELANWARAVVVIRSIGAHTVFEIVLGKRGKRAGLRTDEGDPVYNFYIKHAEQGICWEVADTSDLDSDSKTKPGKSELLALIPETGCIGQHALQNEAKSKEGIGINSCRALLAELIESASIFEWRTPRPGTRDALGYGQHPQDKKGAE